MKRLIRPCFLISKFVCTLIEGNWNDKSMNLYFEILLGIVLAISFLYVVCWQNVLSQQKIFQWGLVLAASIYFFLSLFLGDLKWIAIEASGIFIYGLFAWLGGKYTATWIGIGWLLHPIWDGFLHLFGAHPIIVLHWYAMICLVFDLIVGWYIIFFPLRQLGYHINRMDLMGNNSNLKSRK